MTPPLPHTPGPHSTAPPTSPVPQRKPPAIAWESFVERRIREAQAAGAFDNLPGHGRPIPGIDEPLEEDWWIRQKLRDEGVNVLPPLLAARLDRERTLDGLAALRSEAEVRRALADLNDRLLVAIKSPETGPAIAVSLVDIDATVSSWRNSQ